MSREKIILFCVVIAIAFVTVTVTACIAKPEINKTFILRLIK